MTSDRKFVELDPTDQAALKAYATRFQIDLDDLLNPEANEFYGCTLASGSRYTIASIDDDIYEVTVVLKDGIYVGYDVIGFEKS